MLQRQLSESMQTEQKAKPDKPVTKAIAAPQPAPAAPAPATPAQKD